MKRIRQYCPGDTALMLARYCPSVAHVPPMLPQSCFNFSAPDNVVRILNTVLTLLWVHPACANAVLTLPWSPMLTQCCHAVFRMPLCSYYVALIRCWHNDVKYRSDVVILLYVILMLFCCCPYVAMMLPLCTLSLSWFFRMLSWCGLDVVLILSCCFLFVVLRLPWCFLDVILIVP